MLIIHTSDWHIGRTLHGADLYDAHKLFLSHLLKRLRTENIDALLIAGDIFDRSIAPINSLNLLSDFLHEASKHSTIIISAGNHDSAERLGFLSEHLNKKIHIVANLGEMCKPIDITDKNGVAARIYAIPYLHPDKYRWQLASKDFRTFAENNIFTPCTTEEQIEPIERSHHAIMKRALWHIGQAETASPVGNETPIIIMAHQFVSGAQMSDSEASIAVGGIDNIPANIFFNYGAEQNNRSDLQAPKYVALGHLHRGQKVALTNALKAEYSTELRYSGSPIAFSFSEAPYKKTYVELHIHAGSFIIKTHACPVERNILSIKDNMQNLLESDLYRHCENFYLQITVTDQIRPAHMVPRLKQRFPYALNFDCLANHDNNTRNINAGKAVKNNPLHTCERFCEAMNIDIGEEQKQILTDLLEELGQNQ